MHRIFRSLPLLIIASCLLSAGCYRSDRPAMAPVHGWVTYRGKPVVGASVAFLCPGAPRLATGTTDESGQYRLTTFEPDDGAMIGTHVVTVRKLSGGDVIAELPGQPTDRAAMNRAIEQSMNKTAQQIEKAQKEGSPLPARYADQRTSDLHKEVVAGDNVINIELVD